MTRTARPIVATIMGGLALVLLCNGAAAETVVEEQLRTQYQSLRLVRVVENLEHPWAVAWLPDGAMLVTERPGRLVLVRDGDKSEVTGLPEVFSRNQGGLLDVAVHPGFENNNWIYLTYSKGDREGTATTLVRGRLENSTLEDVEEIFTQDRKSSPGRHYGSRLAFLDDGTMLMSIGDRGADPPRAQDLDDHAGTLLRLNDDGSVPEDNPFVGRDDAHPEIYSYGHRNIQGIIVHPETGEIWVHDHGPRGGDRLDLIEPGANYGWPSVSLGRDYRTQEPWSEQRYQSGMLPPVHEFLPTVAPSGLALVTSEHFEDWHGDLLVGGLRSRQIRRVVVEQGPTMVVERAESPNGERTEKWVEGPYVAHEEALLHDTIGRIRDVRQGPDGFIYVITDASDGGVYRIEPTD